MQNTLLAVSLALAGCGGSMCDPGQVGEPWKPYQQLLPDDTVVCGPNRLHHGKTEIDDYPPTQVFVYFKTDNAPAAFDKTLKKFEAGGFTVTDLQVYGKGADGTYNGEVTRDGTKIDIMVNQNDFGIQGSFKITPAATP